MKFHEPSIAINGVILTDAQSSTMRVAISEFHARMVMEANGGIDDALIARSMEVLRAMIPVAEFAK